MRYIILVLSMTLLVGQSYSQPYFNWAESYGNNGDEENCTDIKWSSDGGLLSFGNFEGVLNLGLPGAEQLESGGDTDMYLRKQDQDGNTLWAKRFGGGGEDRAASIAIDEQNNIYCIGSFSDTLNLGLDTLYSHGGLDLVLLKLDALGELIWSFQLGGLQDDEGLDLSLDPSGRPHLTFDHRNLSYFHSGSGTDSLISNGLKDIGIMKLDGDGNVLWSHSFGSGEGTDNAGRIATDNLGNVYAYGSFRDQIDFDPGPDTTLVSALGRDLFLLKLDSMGSFRWVKRIGGVSEESSHQVLVSGTEIFITGSFMGSLTTFLTGSDSTLFSNGNFDAFVVKLNTTGQFQWGRALGDDSFDTGLDLAIDTAGELLVSGVFTSQIDLDPGPGTWLVEGTAGYRAMYLIRLDPNGGFVYGTGFIGERDCYMDAIDIRSDGAIAAAGRLKGGADLAPHGAYHFVQANFGSFDLFTARLDPCPPAPFTGSVQACDLYEWNGMTYDSSGVYTQAFQTMSGCDSILTIDVDINYSSWTDLEFNSCDEVIFNGISYSESGVYEQHFMTLAGCDSTISLDIDIPVLDTTVLSTPPFLTSLAEGVSYQWLDCDNGFIPINGATSSEFQASQNGSYAIQITEGACVDTSSCHVIQGIGIHEFNSSTISLYPNPASGHIYVASPSRIDRLEIFSLTGSKVLEIHGLAGDSPVDVSSLETGMYLIRLSSEEQVYLSPLIIKD